MYVMGGLQSIKELFSLKPVNPIDRILKVNKSLIDIESAIAARRHRANCPP
jgi:hypothetical protein